MQKLCFDVYKEDNKVGRIELDGNTVVKNESYFDISKEPYPPMVNPFIYMKDGLTVRRYLATRVVPPERADIDFVLDALGLKEYNVYRMLEKTHGAKVDDFIWLKFDHVPDDGKTWKDINPRRKC